ncbi:MAG TPA: IPT/TIG domain-containing protein [Longimicrobium sp.]
MLLLAAASACRDGAGSGDGRAPVLSSISPDTATAGRADVAFSVRGSGFGRESVVNWNSTPLPTTFVNKKELRATVPQAQLSEGGQVSITVASTTPGGGTSGQAWFTVRQPAPVIVSLSADTFNLAQLSGEITIEGSGFTRATVVRWNGVVQTATYQSPTRLAVTLNANGVAPGITSLEVSNPTPGGGTAAATFTVYSPVPVIAVLPSSGATALRPGFSLWVHGRDFVQGARVLWNGAERPATYVSPTRLQVSVSSADVAAAGGITLSVVNPGPGNRVSNTATVVVRLAGSTSAVVQRLRIEASDLAWDAARGLLYLSIPSTGGALANSVVAVDPMTLQVTRSVFVGSDPGRVARSDDGQYLYVGLNGANAVRRVDLGTFTAGLQWSLPAGQIAGDMEVAPGQANTVAVSRYRPRFSPLLDGVTVYDAGVARPNSSPGHTGASRIEFSDSASVLYGSDLDQSTFYTLAVDASGARHLNATPDMIHPLYSDIVRGPGRIYSTDGSVIDADRRVRLGTLERGLSLAVDPALGRVFVLRDPIPTGNGIAVYDLNTFQLLGTVLVSNLAFHHPAARSARLLRWGRDGLAFLDQDELVIIRTPIAAP